MSKFIGRKDEKKILQEALSSDEAEMVAVIGRRRVGKTFLIKHAYKKHIVFELTGIQNGALQQQLINFKEQLLLFSGKDITGSFRPPSDWFEAFRQLKAYLIPLAKKSKKVVFFDELPWLANPKSKFLSALGYFWNSWAAWENIVLVICGSAASWIIQKVVNDKGGLHNRITKYIQLKPFTLAETKAYLKSKKGNFNHYQIVQIYMALGGIPHYLKEVKKGQSAIQNIEQLCFSPNGLLRTEFLNLYPALFKNAERHIAIIRTLAKKRQGMTRNEIIAKAKAPNGGATSTTLEELIQSNFIAAYHPFGKRKKERLYRLIDEYSLFYLQFMEDKTNEGKDIWQKLSQTQEFKTWTGLCF